MIPSPLQTRNLNLVPKTRDQVEAMIEAMSPEQKAQLSSDWLARVRSSSTVDPWVHGFSAVHRESGSCGGTAGFKAPPADGTVEIAYGVVAGHQSKGYATEMAQALVAYDFLFPVIEIVRAHTLANAHASKRLLAKCGFVYVGDIIDPEALSASRRVADAGPPVLARARAAFRRGGIELSPERTVGDQRRLVVDHFPAFFSRLSKEKESDFEPEPLGDFSASAKKGSQPGSRAIADDEQPCGGRSTRAVEPPEATPQVYGDMADTIEPNRRR